MAEPRTKKIRIAVAVDSEGSWNAMSYGGPAFPGVTESDWRASAEGFVWVEAEIPLPEDSVTVQGVAGELESEEVERG